MYFMTQLPKWNGMDAILMVVNQFSKLPKMAPSTIVIILDLVKLFFDMWIRHHGMSQFIISDRDALVLEGGDEIVISSMVFHPQTNGQIERVNGVLN